MYLLTPDPSPLTPISPPLAPHCVFCQKLAQLDLLPEEDIVWQFAHSVALLGPWQFYNGYCVLIAREHAVELSGLGSKRTAYLEEMALLAEAIEKCFSPHKINYELLGNQVPHLHWHLFPRSKEDPDRLRPVWFALDQAEANAEEKTRLQSGIIPRSECTRRLRDYLERHSK